MSLGLAVPLLNEEALIDEVAADIVETLDAEGVPFTLALVDNGSTDRTGERVDRWTERDGRVHAVHLLQNAGYGGGILAGIHALQRVGLPDVVGWCWGDGQVDPAVLPGLYRSCQEGVMLAKARRVERQDGLQRRLITTGYAAVTRLMGVQTRDVNGCPKLLRREAWLALDPKHTDWFLDAEVVLGAEARGWSIADAPVVMRARRAGKSKVKLATVLEFGRNLGGWRG